MSSAESGRTAEPKLGVVVVNYASSHLLELLAIEPSESLAVIVVDNYSGEAERQRVIELCRRRGWNCELQRNNSGFGLGMNAGFDRALELGCEALLALNADTEVSADVLEGLRCAVGENPRALISPVMVTGSGESYFRGSQLDLRTGRTRGGWSDQPDRQDPQYADWLTGACLAMHRDAYQTLGGFADNYFLYWEDVDLSRRAVEQGLSLILRRDLTIVHDEGGTQRTKAAAARHRADVKSSIYYRYNCRNRLVFGAGHLDRRRLLRWIVLTPRESWRILIRGGRRHILTAPSHPAAALHGSLSGIRIAVRALLTGASSDRSLRQRGESR